MAGIAEETLKQIRDRIRISDVASRYSKIEHRGNELWCCCPIHGEKTASMILHDDTGFYHCFGCGKSGTIFNLVMEMEKVPFLEAVKMLAAQAGIDLKPLTPEEEAENKMKDALYGLYDRLATYCHNVLLKSVTSEVKAARSYLEKRKVEHKMWDTFLIGFMPDRYFNAKGDFSIHRMLLDAGFSKELLAASGLFSKREGKEDYCLFSGRVLFPIRDSAGRTVAFSGRDLTGRSRAKYINSSESPIFSKRDNLLGLYESLPALKAKDSKRRIIICEGNFDVVALHQAGMTYAMASCGTAFTSDHARLMKRYADTVTCLFDSDAAGQKATKSALVILQDASITGNVAHLSLGKDASEVLEKNGAAALQQELEKTKDGYEYLVDSALTQYDIRKPDDKLGVLDALVPYLEVTHSSIVLDDLLGRLAGTLGVAKESIASDFAKRKSMDARRRTYEPTRAAVPEAQEPVVKPSMEAKPVIKPLLTNNIDIDLRCMLYVVNHRDLFDEVRQRLQIEDMRNEEARVLYGVLEDVKREGAGEVSNEYILKKIEDPQLASDVNASFALKEFTENSENMISEALCRIKIRNLETRTKEIQKLLSLASGDKDEMGRLIQELLEVNKEVAGAKEEQRKLSSLGDRQ